MKALVGFYFRKAPYYVLKYLLLFAGANFLDDVNDNYGPLLYSLMPILFIFIFLEGKNR